MEFEYGLVENALHSLREAMNYYHEGDETTNATQYKFSILLSAHCAELLLKEVLRRSHPALLFEDIDHIKDLQNNDNQTVGFKTAILRVKNLCQVDLQQYEQYLDELGKVRNQIQHYKYQIKGEYHKALMARTFSAIEFLFRDVLNLRFEDYADIIDNEDIEFLHEDIATNEARKADIIKEFKEGRAKKFKLEYSDGKYINICCPICGTESLAIDKTIKCKFCGSEFQDYIALHAADDNCTTSHNILRELGRRKHLLESKIYQCPDCKFEAIVKSSAGDWSCLICGFHVDDSASCDECACDIPNSEKIYRVAISYLNADDFKYLCPSCAQRLRNSDLYFDYEIS